MKLVDATKKAIEIDSRHPGKLFTGVDIGLFKIFQIIQTPQAATVVYSRLIMYDDVLASAGIAFESIEVPLHLSGNKNSAQGKIGLNGEDFWIGIQAETRNDFDAMLNRIKGIQGRHYEAEWKGRRNCWWLPVGFGTAKELAQLVAEGRYEIEPAAAQRVYEELNKGNTQIKLSKSATGTFNCPAFKKTPRPYQCTAFDYIDNTGNTLIADDMGLGKTVTVLAYAEMRDLFPLLVVCPKSVKPGWARELRECLPNRTVQVIGPETKAINPAADLYVVSWNLLSTGWLDKKKKSVKLRPVVAQLLGQGLFSNRKPIKAMVCDESHKMKEPDTQQTCAAFQIADALDEFINGSLNIAKGVLRLCLTGTPYPNRPRELISQLMFLKKLAQFGGAWNFYKRYCDAKQEWIPSIRKKVWNLNGSSNESELQERLRAVVMLRRLKSEVAKDMPKKTVTILDVEITNEDEYRKAEKSVAKTAAELAVMKKEWLDSIAHLPPAEQKARTEAQKIHVFIRNKENEALQKYNVLRQVLAVGKLEAFKDFARDFKSTGRKLAVFAWFRESQQILLDALKSLGYNAVTLAGADSDAIRAANISRFSKDPSCDGIVVSISAGGTGVDGLQRGCSDAYFFEWPFVPGDQDQAEDRLHRDGQTQPVTINIGAAVDTIDGDILDILSEKRASIQAGLNGISQNTEIKIDELCQRMLRRVS